jgi:hypothetical protein
MALVGGSFLALVARPFLFEFGKSHRVGARLVSSHGTGMTDNYKIWGQTESTNRAEKGRENVAAR